MTSEEYLLLYEKYQLGLCTPEEKKQLAKYQDKFRMLDDNGEKLSPEEVELRDRVYARIDQTLFIEKGKIVRIGLRWAAAAILIVGVSVAVVFLNGQHTQLLTNNKVKPQIIGPGRNTATLTLADGSNIRLDDAKDGVILKTGKTAIRKFGGGQIVYDAEGRSLPDEPIAMNTITIPRGGQYQVVLSDGTKVWMNSVSSLRYPARFASNERVVELKGEAYFEVAHNAKMPFKVKTDGVNVEVLGTHFNVAAYEGDPNVKTTLLEGSVRLSNKASMVKLVPGEQGVTTENSNDIAVKNVKVAEVIAWKNGSFVFRHANIQEIMKQISRWYDVDVEYRGDVKDQYFGGTYSKYKNVTELLKGLEATGLIHFKIEGRRIIAMP